jgi:UDP-glucose 4-epimerase
MVLPRFIAQALRGEPLTVYGDGTQTRSFCDVRDTVAALDALASNPASGGEIVNVGNNREISILDLAKLVIQTAESTSKVRKIPYLQAYGEDFEDITHRRPALDKLFGLTGFRHMWTLEETVQDLLDRARNRVAKVV